MSPRDGPDFRDLVDDDLSAEERARLQRVHELIVTAGPPPELPSALAEAPEPEAELEVPGWLPRRRIGAALALAGAIATIAFLGGYLAGFASNDFDSVREITMRGTAGAPGARALIELGDVDSGGNWPMLVTVSGLPQLTGQAYYEMYLTRDGKPVARCGTFKVKSGTTTVRLNAPYRLRRFDGWVVTRREPDTRGPGEILLRT